MNCRISKFLTIAAFAAASLWSPLTLAQEVPELQEQMPYRDAREILIDAGWEAIGVQERQNPSETVTSLVELGYGEVVDCAGTGMGFCRFEFTNVAGEKLAIVTVNNEAGGGGSLVYRWWIEENSQDVPGNQPGQ
jgi:hypothetical protein